MTAAATLTREQILAADVLTLNRWLHTIIAPPWDESSCRVCGMMLGSPHTLNGRGCEADACFNPFWCPSGPRRADTPPDYAGSWAGTRLVVEAMTTRANAFTLSIDDGRCIVAWFGRLGGGTGEAVADTAPLAVARAALLALTA